MTNPTHEPKPWPTKMELTVFDFPEIIEFVWASGPKLAQYKTADGELVTVQRDDELTITRIDDPAIWWELLEVSEILSPSYFKNWLSHLNPDELKLVEVHFRRKEITPIRAKLAERAGVELIGYAYYDEFVYKCPPLEKLGEDGLAQWLTHCKPTRIREVELYLLRGGMDDLASIAEDAGRANCGDEYYYQ